MTLTRKQVAAIFLASVALAAFSAEAMAKPRKHRAARTVAAQMTNVSGYVDPFTQPSRPATLGATEPVARDVASPTRKPGRAVAARAGNEASTMATTSTFASGDLVTEARRYLGSNPTGRARQWCGAFLDLVLKRTGRKGGGNLASAYASYGTRISGPQVGAIAVMRGHVGLVSGIDSTGNPIIISGNHNRTVAESVYPRGRIYAYVMP